MNAGTEHLDGWKERKSGYSRCDCQLRRNFECGGPAK